MEQMIQSMHQGTTRTNIIRYNCNTCKDQGFVVYTGDDGYEYARECHCGRIERKRMSGKLSFANIPDIYRGLTMQDFEIKWYAKDDQERAEKVKMIFRQFLNNYFNITPGMGLYVFSGTKGTGKTRMVSILANELIRKGIDVKFATSGRILDEIKKTWESSYEYTESKLMYDLTTVDILIIDDFGVEKAKDWRNEKFYNIINERYMSKRTTIFTSNYSLEDLERNGYDSRIISRIKEVCYMIPFPGDSVRDAKAKDNQMELKKWISANEGSEAS